MLEGGEEGTVRRFDGLVARIKLFSRRTYGRSFALYEFLSEMLLEVGFGGGLGRLEL